MVKAEEHLGLARKVAFEYYRCSKGKYTYDELESTAFIGLIKAGQRFDESKGVQFSTYAIPNIKWEIQKMFRDDKWYFVKRGVSQVMLSTNYVIDDTNNIEMQEILEDEENIEDNVVNRMTVKMLLNLLSERDKKIVYLYFYKQLSQCQISENTGISQAHVSRIIRTSLKKMKKELVA